MITIQLLEDTDLIDPEDWCRPLQILPMSPQSDYYSFKSCYSGQPENNVEWCKVKHVIGKCWFGKTVLEFHSRFKYCQHSYEYRYEFVRGDIPKSHQLDMKDYNIS